MQSAAKPEVAPRSLPDHAQKQNQKQKQKQKHNQNGILAVFSWELRRMMGKRSTWVLALLTFGLFCALSWLVREPVGIGLSTVPGQPTDLIISARFTSGWGLVHALPIPMLLIFGLFLPFVSADGVSLDLKRCTHELLMTTSISSWAYLCGRYLAVCLFAVALSFLMLSGIAGGAFLYALPVPNPLILFELWGVIILPATLLLASLSFALGVWLPKHSNIVKVLVVTLWIALGIVMQSQQAFNVIGATPNGNIPIIDPKSPSQLAIWEPTSILLSKVVESNYFSQFYNQPGVQLNQPVDAARATQALRAVEQTPPELANWLVPRLVVVVGGAFIFAFANFGFHRFRNQLS